MGIRRVGRSQQNKSNGSYRPVSGPHGPAAPALLFQLVLLRAPLGCHHPRALPSRWFCSLTSCFPPDTRGAQLPPSGLTEASGVGRGSRAQRTQEGPCPGARVPWAGGFPGPPSPACEHLRSQGSIPGPCSPEFETETRAQPAVPTTSI